MPLSKNAPRTSVDFPVVHESVAFSSRAIAVTRRTDARMQNNNHGSGLLTAILHAR